MDSETKLRLMAAGLTWPGAHRDEELAIIEAQTVEELSRIQETTQDIREMVDRIPPGTVVEFPDGSRIYPLEVRRPEAFQYIDGI